MTASYDHRSLAIVIPVCAEEEYLPLTLESLNENFEMEPTSGVHVVLVFNQKPEAVELQKRNRRHLQRLKQEDASFGFSLHLLDQTQGLRQGVGEARRLGMDYAKDEVLHHPDDLILCLDADTLVAKNYLSTLQSLPPSVRGFLVEFEHPLREGPATNTIILYEIYLRYMQVMLEKAGSPFAFIPMGSRIGLSRELYQRTNGMVVKDATEDFHFLNKLRKIHPIEKISATRVYPSARCSNRVYLGTGFFQFSYRERGEAAFSSLRVPPPEAFTDLKHFLTDLLRAYETPEILDSWQDRLVPESFNLPSVRTRIEKLRANSKSAKNYESRVIQIFDALQTWRFLRALRDRPSLARPEALYRGLEAHLGRPGPSEPLSLLQALRAKDLPGRYLPGIKPA